MAGLEKDDPLLHGLLGANSFASRSSSLGRSDPEKVIELWMDGVDIKTARRAVLMSRHWRVSPEEIIERNL